MYIMLNHVSDAHRETVVTALDLRPAARHFG